MRRTFGHIGDGIAMIAFWGLILFLLLTFLTACDEKGQPCPHRGDVKAKSGSVLHCVQTPGGGLEWQ